MKLTTEIVKKYQGGQLEIQNSTENYLYRGEIDKAWVENDTLRVNFKWLAKMGDDGNWHAESNLDYSMSLEIISSSDIGQNRIFYGSFISNEYGTFFPINGSRLDPNKIIGLQLTA